MDARLVAVLVTVATIASAHAQQPQGAPVRSITRLTGDLYRVQNNDHYTVFLVTPDGIILADPINLDAAVWLKTQLAERFPSTPVRYVLYSHHHQDHASGAAAFNDTAELVGHENFQQDPERAGALRGTAGGSRCTRFGSDSTGS